MKFLISAGVGAVIGYITNWLAIKMLFRPYEEKRIFNIKVPFTPGLIPKERHRVAKSVGDTVGNHLLTPEKFKELLEKDSTRVEINKWINEKKNSYKSQDLIVKDVLFEKNILDDEKIEKLSEKTYDYMLKGIKSDRFKVQALSYMDKLYDDVVKIIFNAVEKDSLEYLKKMAGNKKFKEELFSYLLSFDKNYKLNDLISDKDKALIDDLINKNKGPVAEKLRLILNEKKIRDEISKSVSFTVERNVSSLILTFVSTDTISSKITQAIYDYINSSEFDRIVGIGLGKAKEEVLNIEILKIKDFIIDDIGLEKIDDIYNNLVELLFSKLKDNKVNSKIADKVLEELGMIKVNVISEIYNYADKKLGEDKSRIFIVDKIKETIYKLLDMRLNKIIGYLDDDKIKSFVDKIFLYLEKTEYKIIINILEVINIPKIVEDQINSFDLDFAENLILEIAGKELKAITNLGAILGAVIGLINPLLQMIY